MRVHQSLFENAFLRLRARVSSCAICFKRIEPLLTSERKNVTRNVYLRHCPSLFSICCLFCYGAICPLTTLMTFPTLIKLLALQYTHYRDVFKMLNVEKWTNGVAPDSKRTNILSKLIENILKCHRQYHKKLTLTMCKEAVPWNISTQVGLFEHPNKSNK